MNTVTTVGQSTVNIKLLAPALSPAFSPNLYRWLKKFGRHFSHGGIDESVYRIKHGSRLAEHYGADTLMIGTPTSQYEGDTDFSGSLLMAVLCSGAKASRYCYAGSMSDLELVAGFWEAYLKVGRCAIDPDHHKHFIGDRYRMTGDLRTCLWCGASHRQVTTSRVVQDVSWIDVQAGKNDE